MDAPRLRLRTIDLFERQMRFTHPFRFGSVTVQSAPQAFVRVTAEIEGVGVSTGASAEMMMPKWFDKRPELTPDETMDELRQSLLAASRRYLASPDFDTAFGHHARVYGDLPTGDMPVLVRAYGPAVIDKAILDALFKALGVGAGDGMRRNLPGLDARLTPDIDNTAIQMFLEGIKPRKSVALRWTVGLVDDLGGLRREIDKSSLRFLKIKLGGDVRADVSRLEEIGTLIAGLAFPMRLTLDANEQYDPPRLKDLLVHLERGAGLATIRDRLLYVEQPLAREITLETPLSSLETNIPFIIDEADGDYGSFPKAIEKGYGGVSSKSCKGLYKSLLNAVRAETLNRAAGKPRHFLTGEDLTCQAGLGIQQDMALVSLLGLAHAERNGHHYVDGFGPAGEEEASRFSEAHPALYHRGEAGFRLDTKAGALPAETVLAVPGWAGGAEPDWTAMLPLRSSLA